MAVATPPDLAKAYGVAQANCATPIPAYFMVGIANSAPLAIDSGQRCMMLL